MIPSESITAQYRLLVMDGEIKRLMRKMRSVRNFKVKWWNVASENASKLYETIKRENN